MFAANGIYYLFKFGQKHLLNFQSQEVTYAELTLPRNKGYSQMRPAQVGVTAGGEAVVYARIDHARRNHHGHHPQGPLLTSCSSSGGGISPSSLMNTSVDSSAGSSSSSSCTRIMATGPTNIIRNDLGERSSADEGFTSGGSPVGDCGSSSTGSGSGTVRCARLPVLISPDSAAPDTAQLVSTRKKASFVFHSCSSPSTTSLTRCSDDGKSSGTKSPLQLAESLARESTV